MKKIVSSFLSFIKNTVFNNPIVLQAATIAPIVVVGTSLKNATALSLLMLIITLPSVMLSMLLLKRLSMYLRVPCYFIISTIMYLFGGSIVAIIFPDIFESAGIYMPILIINSSLLILCDKYVGTKKYKSACFECVAHILGFVITVFSVSFIRELFGRGTLFGQETFVTKKMSGLLYPFYGYIIIAFFCAGVNWLKAVIRKFFGEDAV